jgi:hypothetical protein
LPGTPTRLQPWGTMKQLNLVQASSRSILTRTKQFRKRKTFLFDLGLIALLAALLTLVNQGLLRKHNTVKASNAIPAAAAVPGQHNAAALAPSADPTANAPVVHASFRALNFALLRGGFTSVDEFFERVQEDPILHSFYGDCSDRNASMHPLAEDVTVFTTFRKNNQIKWSKKPLLVHKGEYVMTFCGKTVLARCGNLVSMAAMQPSEDVPPALLEEPAEPIEPPLSYAAASEPEVAPTPVSPVAAAKKQKFFFIPPFYVPPGGSHSTPPVVVPPVSVPPTSVTPPTSPTPPPSTPPPSTPPPPPPTVTPPPPPPSTPPPSTPPSAPTPPPSHLSGDEFDGHQALVTFLLGLFAIGLIKLLTR